jgi:hypothetical protein
MALCGDSVDDPVLFKQAVIVAENDLVLRRINEHQVDVIERLRDPFVLPFSRPDNTPELMKARIRKKEEARSAIVALRDALLKKYKGRFPHVPEDYSTEMDAFFPAHLEEFLVENERKLGADELANIGLRDKDCVHERDQGEALEIAIKDLARLHRYERRAASRMRQAMFAFIELKRENASRAQRMLARKADEYDVLARDRL